MTWRGSKLLKHFLQFVLLMMAWFTCLSRISDYKHHWSDVMSGAVLGATIATLVVSLYKLFCLRNKKMLKTFFTFYRQIASLIWDGDKRVKWHKCATNLAHIRTRPTEMRQCEILKWTTKQWFPRYTDSNWWINESLLIYFKIICQWTNRLSFCRLDWFANASALGAM